MIEIRRILSQVEDIHHEFGPVAAVAPRRGWIAAVLTNPPGATWPTSCR